MRETRRGLWQGWFAAALVLFFCALPGAFGVASATAKTFGPFWVGKVEGVRARHSFVTERDGRILAFLAGGDGLHVLDVTDPAHPVSLSDVDEPDCADVFVAGNYAYLACGGNGLVVYDVSDPEHPRFVAGRDEPMAMGDYQRSSGVFVAGDYAYLADWVGGLKVVNVSDPRNPVIVGRLGHCGEGVFVVGRYAYLVCDLGTEEEDPGLYIYDVSTPGEAPLPLGFVKIEDGAGRVFVSGDHAYVVGWKPGGSTLKVVDVSNPSLPRIVARVGSDGGVTSPSDVFVSGGHAYLADGDGVTILEVSHPEEPTLAAHVSVATASTGVFVFANRAYLSQEYGGLRIVDVSSPQERLSVVWTDPEGDYFADAWATGDRLYAAANGLLKVFDLSGGMPPRKLGEASVPAAEGLFVSGDRAYVASLYRGLDILDVSDPAAPTPVGHFDTAAFGATAVDVQVDGGYAYLAGREGGLVVVNVGTPEAPSLAARASTHLAMGVFKAGSYLFVADGEEGLKVFDVSDPGQPRQTGSAASGGFASEVFVSGHHAYVADGTGGLAVFDVSRPDEPRLVGRGQSLVGRNVSIYGDNAQGVFVVGRYAYVANGDVDLVVFDVSDPEEPRVVGVLDTEGGSDRVFVHGRYAYLGDWMGLKAVELVSAEEASSWCAPDSPNFCPTEASCRAAGGHWCAGVCQVAPCEGSEEPVAVDLKVNGEDQPAPLSREDRLTITVSLDPKGLEAQGDYFLRAAIPGGETYWFVYPGQWVPSSAPVPAYQGALVPFEGLAVASVPCQGLPLGDYELTFTVDTVPDGNLDPGAASDTVRFTIVKYR